MQLGHHFGKQKESKNSGLALFLEKQTYFLRKNNYLVKFTALSLLVQAVVLFPLLYWTLQNYSFFQDNVPDSYHLKNYLITEKKWVIFLYFFGLTLSSVINFGLFFKAAQQSAEAIYENEILPAAVDDQRHAS